MDPVSALGIAASVVQFLQFGSSLVSKIRQIYSQGALSDHVECESATRRLVDLTKQITNDLTDLGSLGALSLDSQALQKICEKCVELSNELLSRLADLHGNETHKARKWKSFRHALKTVCSKEKIDDIAGRLKGYSVELHLHLIMAIKNKADVLELQQEVAINAQNTQAEKTIKTITDSHEGFQKEFIEQLESLIQSNKDSHNQTRKSLLYALGQARSTEMSILASFTVSYHKRSPARNS